MEFFKANEKAALERAKGKGGAWRRKNIILSHFRSLVVGVVDPQASREFSESPTYARTLLFKIAGHGRSNSLRRAGNQPTTDKVKREGDETDRHDEDLKLQNGSLGSAIADLYCATSRPSLVQNKGSRQGIMGKHVRKHRFPRVAGYRYINLSGYVDLLQKTVDIVAS
ncbi:hypothetical protein MaudMau93_006497 [Microsporum audouinii]